MIDYWGGKTFTPKYPAFAIIGHYYSISAYGHPNIYIIAPFCPFLKLSGWLITGWFQIKSSGSRTKVANGDPFFKA